MAMSDWKALRERAGLERQQLAAKLGVGVDTVRRWEEPEYGLTPSIAYQRQIEAIVQHREEVGLA